MHTTRMRTLNIHLYVRLLLFFFFFFFFNDTATTEIYTLSLHDALPISLTRLDAETLRDSILFIAGRLDETRYGTPELLRSEEHTSELQSRSDLVCRLLLEKKKKYNTERYQHSNH